MQASVLSSRYRRRPMTAYEIALFIHFLGLITLFGAFVLMQRGGARVRQAATVGELRLWLGLLQTTRPMFPASSVFLLASGLYMTADVWTFETPWVVVGIVSVVAFAVVGPTVVGRGLGAIGAAAATAGEGPVPAELTERIAEPRPWIAMSAMNGAAIGLVWIMVTKPGWAGAIGVVLGLALVGGIIGSRVLRRR